MWATLSYTTFSAPLNRLGSNPNWKLVYANAVATIFVRSERGDVYPESPRLQELLTIDEPQLSGLPGLPEGPPRAGELGRWINGFVTACRFPRDEFSRSRFHLIRGETQLAARRYAERIRRSGGHDFEF